MFTWIPSGGLTIAERDDYVRSVKCLMNTTSMLDPKSYPGAKSRYDDFVVVHMNMTPSVHGTVSSPIRQMLNPLANIAGKFPPLA